MDKAVFEVIEADGESFFEEVEVIEIDSPEALADYFESLE